MNTDQHEPQGSQPLFDPREFAAGGGAGRSRPARPFKERANDALWAGIRAAGAFCGRRWPRRVLIGAGVVGLAGGAVWAYDHWTVRPPPNFAVAELDDVLDYTLLTEEFNRLPLADRLRLIKELVERMKGMNADDSALMAAFAAGIMGPAREQLRRNAERLAIDVWDNFAKDYSGVKPEDRTAFLDRSIIEFGKLIEDLGGFASGLSDQERLAQAKGQAQRDAERARERAGAPDRERLGGFMAFMDRQSDQVPDVTQRSRMARFSRDMTRHLRGQDLATGRPKGGG